MEFRTSNQASCLASPWELQLHLGGHAPKHGVTDYQLHRVKSSVLHILSGHARGEEAIYSTSHWAPRYPSGALDGCGGGWHHSVVNGVSSCLIVSRRWCWGVVIQALGPRNMGFHGAWYIPPCFLTSRRKNWVRISSSIFDYHQIQGRWWKNLVRAWSR